MKSKSSKSYFDTTHATPEQVEAYTLIAESQNKDILTIFIASPEKRFTPRDIHRRLKKKIELTSVRRSITTLQKCGVLCKDTNKKIGEALGRANYTWFYPAKNVNSQTGQS